MRNHYFQKDSFTKLKTSAFIPFSLAFFLSLGSEGAWASDFHSPRTSALGGATHAAPLLSDAIYMNPSYASFVETHAFSMNYQKFDRGHIANAAVLDGTGDSLFQAGISYTRRPDATLIQVGAAKSPSKSIGIGLGGKFLFPNDNSGDSISDMTLSATGIFGKAFEASLIIDNLVQSSPRRGLYREFLIGTKINVDRIIILYLDPHFVPDLPDGIAKWGWEAGIEFPFFTDLYLRVGNFRSAFIPQLVDRGDGWSIGAGWIAPKLSIDYAFSRVVAPTFTSTHTVGMTIYF